MRIYCAGLDLMKWTNTSVTVSIRFVYFCPEEVVNNKRAKLTS